MIKSKNDYQIYYLKCNVVGISNLKSCPSIKGDSFFKFLMSRIYIPPLEEDIA